MGGRTHCEVVFWLEGADLEGLGGLPVEVVEGLDFWEAGCWFGEAWSGGSLSFLGSMISG